jgi:uncharacterized protein (DUF58 family)
VLHGMHRSKHHGSSVEFSEHKKYSPGDDVRHLDWRAFARHDRDYIKQFEDESSVRALIVVDVSGSMKYCREGENQLSKQSYAMTCAGALAYVLARQGDSVGLASFSDQFRIEVPPRARRGQLQEIFSRLESLECGGETKFGAAFNALAEGMSKRMALIFFTDLLDSNAEAMQALSRVAARRHDVSLFHILDPDEIDFPFEGSTLFTDLEGPREVPIDAQAIKSAYLEEVSDFLMRVKNESRSARVSYELVRTDQSPSSLLRRYLSARTQTRRSVR